MASAISGFINTIKTAIYGEQVRTAIVNALEQCYSDVNSPSLQTEGFLAALNEAYAGGILDIQTVTKISDMTNEQIIYRYNGTETGKQKGLYYYSALASGWVLIGSEIQNVTNANQMADQNSLYRYKGNSSGMVNNAIYAYNGTEWIPIGSGLLTASAAALMTNTGAIYKYTGSESGYITNALYYYNGTAWVPIADFTGINTKMTNVIGALSSIQQMLNRGVFSGDISASNTELRRYMSALVGDEDDGINYINRISATAGALIDIGVEWADAYYTNVNCANNGTSAYRMLFSSDPTSNSGSYFGVATGSSANIMSLQVGTKYKESLNFGVLTTLAQNDSSAKTRVPTQDGTQHIIAINNTCYIYQITLENDEGELILDLRPCVDDNEVVCFYDRVSETYIYNTGSGSFAEG